MPFFLIIGFSLLLMGILLLRSGIKRKDPGLISGGSGMILGSVFLFFFVWILLRINNYPL
ncbi:MAG TPA: hypothetical protein VJB99_04180 [Patescibacteria group bacterium]|nr:hypothetical protein [Patescibacteria group bacterium]